MHRTIQTPEASKSQPVMPSCCTDARYTKQEPPLSAVFGQHEAPPGHHTPKVCAHLPNVSEMGDQHHSLTRAGLHSKPPHLPVQLHKETGWRLTHVTHFQSTFSHTLFVKDCAHVAHPHLPSQPTTLPLPNSLTSPPCQSQNTLDGPPAAVLLRPVCVCLGQRCPPGAAPVASGKRQAAGGGAVWFRHRGTCIRGLPGVDAFGFVQGTVQGGTNLPGHTHLCAEAPPDRSRAPAVHAICVVTPDILTRLPVVAPSPGAALCRCGSPCLGPHRSCC